MFRTLSRAFSSMISSRPHTLLLILMVSQSSINQQHNSASGHEIFYKFMLCASSVIFLYVLYVVQKFPCTISENRSIVIQKFTLIIFLNWEYFRFPRHRQSLNCEHFRFPRHRHSYSTITLWKRVTKKPWLVCRNFSTSFTCLSYL